MSYNSSMANDTLGSLEEIILLAVLFLKPEAYGSNIREAIKVRAKRDVSIGALYITLERLEKKGYLKMELKNPTAERGERRRAYYEVTGLGQSVLDDAERSRSAMRPQVAL